jgi:hypothetical protein
MGPFLAGVEDPERSVSWWGYACGKRSIELDLDAQRDSFLELVKRADFLIEAEPVGSLDARGLGYAALRRHNPALIHVSKPDQKRRGRLRILRCSRALARCRSPATRIVRRFE